MARGCPSWVYVTTALARNAELSESVGRVAGDVELAQPGAHAAVFFQIRPQHTNKCLDVTGAATGDGVRVQQ